MIVAEVEDLLKIHQMMETYLGMYEETLQTLLLPLSFVSQK